MSSSLRVVLLYPPPWKIAEPGAPVENPGWPASEGPPGGKAPMLEGDFIEIPYGLLTLAAQTIEQGHAVTVLNLSTFPWPEVERVLAGLEADLYGISCFTSNRRGMFSTAEAIRELHPDAHIVVGGPHPSALPGETLDHCPAIDTAVIGEGEATFGELVDRLARGADLTGLPGTAWRGNDEAVIGPARDRITDLDRLASPHDHFTTPFVITSRGCPGRCTFCGSSAMWGRKTTFHGVAYVLDLLERAVRERGQRLLAFKDDTFTVNRRRVLEVCRGIADRKLDFLWVCDTRVDCLDEELLLAMRRAGCQRLSLGIESGCRSILRSINKRLDPNLVCDITSTARRLGFQLRFYMMAGNRGETSETFAESLDLIERARPDQYLFSPLSIYPGTEEFHLLQRDHGVASTIYHSAQADFFHPVIFPDTSPETERRILAWLREHPGIQDLHEPTVEECTAALQRLGDLHTAHMALGAAYLRAGRIDDAAVSVERALKLHHPLPGIGHTYLACIAHARNDLETTRDQLRLAAADYPHRHVMENARRFDAWEEAGRPAGKLTLIADGDLDLAVELRQPTNPGPIELAETL